MDRLGGTGWLVQGWHGIRKAHKEGRGGGGVEMSRMGTSSYPSRTGEADAHYSCLFFFCWNEQHTIIPIARCVISHDSSIFLVLLFIIGTFLAHTESSSHRYLVHGSKYWRRAFFFGYETHDWKACRLVGARLGRGPIQKKTGVVA